MIQDHLDDLHNNETTKAEEKEVKEHRSANKEVGQQLHHLIDANKAYVLEQRIRHTVQDLTGADSLTGMLV